MAGVTQVWATGVSTITYFCFEECFLGFNNVDMTLYAHTIGISSTHTVTVACSVSRRARARFRLVYGCEELYTLELGLPRLKEACTVPYNVNLSSAPRVY